MLKRMFKRTSPTCPRCGKPTKKWDKRILGVLQSVPVYKCVNPECQEKEGKTIYFILECGRKKIIKPFI